MKVRQASNIRLHIINLLKGQSTALLALKNILKTNSILYTQSTNLNQFNQIFKVKNLQQMVIIDNSEPIKFQLPSFDDNYQIFFYPKKDLKQKYKTIPNAGLLIKQYNRILSESNQHKVIKIRSLYQSPNNKQKYGQLILHDMSQSNQIYEQLFKCIKNYPFVQVIKDKSQIPKNKDQRSLIITTIEGQQQLNNKTDNFKLSRYADLCIYGIKPIKSLLETNIILATDDYLELIDYLIFKGFNLNDAKLKLSYLKKRISSETQSVQSKKNVGFTEGNHKKQTKDTSNPKKTSIILEEHRILVLDSQNQFKVQESYDEINPPFILPSSNQRNISQTQNLNIFQSSNQQNLLKQQNRISIQEQKKNNEIKNNKQKILKWKVYLNKDINKYITCMIQQNNKVKENTKQEQSQKISLNSSIKANNTNESKHNNAVKKQYIISQIIPQLSEEYHKSIGADSLIYNNQSFNRVSLNGITTISQKLSTQQINTPKNNPNIPTNHSNIIASKKTQRVSININNNQKNNKNQSNIKKIKKYYIEPKTIYENIEEKSEDKINQKKPQSNFQTNNHELSHSIIFEEQNQSKNKNINQNQHKFQSYMNSHKSQIKNNSKFIKNFQNYYNPTVYKIANPLPQSNNNSLEGNEDTVIVYDQESHPQRNYSNHTSQIQTHYMNSNPQSIYNLKDLVRKKEQIEKRNYQIQIKNRDNQNNERKHSVHLQNQQIDKIFDSHSTKIISPISSDRVVYSQSRISQIRASNQNQIYKVNTIQIQTSPRVEKKRQYHKRSNEKYFSPIIKVTQPM